MDFNHNDVRRMVEGDRFSNLPAELINKILSSFDMKFVVQTCLLLSSWESLWASMTCLNFSSEHFGTLHKFAKFVNHVLSHRNHQIGLSSVKLQFHKAASQIFIKKIADYALSHNVQQLTVIYRPKIRHSDCTFSSPSLKHFTLTSLMHVWDITTTTLDFSALTTLNLSNIRLCGDIFSKCVNLKNLTLERFNGVGFEGVDIITPCLSNLMLINSYGINTINVNAPQLKNLTIINCAINNVNAPQGLSSFCYTARIFTYGILEFSNEGFHSLNKVSICLSLYNPNMPYEERVYGKTISMLQKLHSAKYLTLNADAVECISSFPDLVSQNPLPFSNLICLTIIDSKDAAHKVKMFNEARNFLLEKSPNANIIVE